MDLLSRLNAAQILIAENDRPTMERLTDILEGAGYNVQNAYFGGDALWTMTGQYDLVLLNANMQTRNNHHPGDAAVRADAVDRAGNGQPRTSTRRCAQARSARFPPTNAQPACSGSLRQRSTASLYPTTKKTTLQRTGGKRIRLMKR